MFAKAWHYIAQKITKRQPQEEKVTVLPFTRNSQHSAFALYKKTLPKLTFSLDEEQAESQSKAEYKLVIERDEQFNEKMKNKSEELQYNQAIIDDVRELTDRVKRLSLQEKRVHDAQSKTNIYDPQKYAKTRKEQQAEKQILDFKRDYNREITQFRMCKYTKEREDYPNISFDHFARIQTIWREKKRGAAEIKKTKLESVEKLTFKAMGGIDHGEWLNDDAINIYIELMDKNLTKNSQCKLLNSYFATTTMGKTENMILRYLKKKGIDKNCSLIMPVNDRRHWFFAKFEGNTLTVYDSIRKRSDEYFEYSIFKNALKFGKNLYGVDLTIEVSPTYPQQNNGYDCGVFMLLGIRDSLRGREWSFRQGDMRFKRTQLACEIYNQQLYLGTA